MASIPPSLDSSISTVKMTYRRINTSLLFDSQDDERKATHRRLKTSFIMKLNFP